MKKLQEQLDAGFVERGADIEHERWGRWQKYLNSRLIYVEYKKDNMTFAGYLMDAGDYERWSRQIDTCYKDLSEKEKESDRKETRNYLELIHARDLAIVTAVIERINKEFEEDEFGEEGRVYTTDMFNGVLENILSELEGGK